MKKFNVFDAPTTTLLIGLAVGLGIVVHGVFFLVALIIAVVALSRHVFEVISEHAHHASLTHRHP
jgi:uncharacterized membrane protein YhiD involved in acid resistance